MNMEWLNSTPDLTWLQLILISFIGNLCGSLLCTYIDRYEAEKQKERKRQIRKLKMPHQIYMMVLNLKVNLKHMFINN